MKMKRPEAKAHFKEWLDAMYAQEPVDPSKM